MSSLYEKQMAWKKSNVSRTQAGSVKFEDGLTFRPTIYTSKATSNSYKVDARATELTREFGSKHIQRYEKARQIKVDGEKKLYNTGARPSSGSRSKGRMSAEEQAQTKAQHESQSGYSASSNIVPLKQRDGYSTLLPPSPGIKERSQSVEIAQATVMAGQQAGLIPSPAHVAQAGVETMVDTDTDDNNSHVSRSRLESSEFYRRASLDGTDVGDSRISPPVDRMESPRPMQSPYVGTFSS